MIKDGGGGGGDKADVVGKRFFFSLKLHKIYLTIGDEERGCVGNLCLRRDV